LEMLEDLVGFQAERDSQVAQGLRLWAADLVPALGAYKIMHCNCQLLNVHWDDYIGQTGISQSETGKVDV
jgi:hypothetical protein